MRYVGAGFDIGPEPTADSSRVALLAQQDGADPGRTSFVQFDGDPDPVAPVRGDVRIVQRASKATYGADSVAPGNGAHQASTTITAPTVAADDTELIVVVGTYDSNIIVAPTATGVTFVELWSDSLATSGISTAAYRARVETADSGKTITFGGSAAVAFTAPGAADTAPLSSAAYGEAASAAALDPPASAVPASDNSLVVAVLWTAGIRTVTAPGNMTPGADAADGASARRTPTIAYVEQSIAAAFDPDGWAVAGGNTGVVGRTLILTP